MKVWRHPILWISTLGLLGSSSPLDLDVGIPPGSPISWGQRFPVITTRGVPLFPAPRLAGAATLGQGQRATHTVAQPRPTAGTVRVASSFGILRILTWDLTGHLQWVTRQETGGRGPVTGRSDREPPLPTPNDSLYWVCMTPLLRLMLHPQIVSKTELIAHLVEIGEPVAAVLQNARSEASLAGACAAVSKMISASRRGVTPLPGKTVRETMLKRFLVEELVRDFPYDPNGGFGERFLLLSEAVEPLLIDYSAHQDPLVRRNAITALGRLGTVSALRRLNAVAIETKDSVVLMRSLAALSHHRYMPGAEALVRRARDAGNPAERIALVVALGYCQRREAVPFLTKLAGSRARPDLQLAALAALARIGFAPAGGALQRLAGRIEKLAVKSPTAFMVRTAESAVRADVPDGPALRARTVAQMALILRVRLDPTDSAAVNKLLALVDGKGVAKPGGRADSRSAGARARARRSRSAFSNSAMGDVAPPVQLLFLETLRELGAAGLAILQKVASSRTTEPILRGHAMLQLPFEARRATTEMVAADTLETPEVRAYAFDALLQTGSKKIPGLCNALLLDCAKSPPRDAAPEERHMWRQALLALGARDALDIKRLERLLKYAVVRKEAHNDNAIIEQVTQLVGVIVDAAVTRRKNKRRRDEINAVLDIVIKERLRAYHTEKRRPAALVYIEKQLDGLRRKRKDTRYQSIVRRSILSYLLGPALPTSVRDKVQPRPVIQFEEEILFALGRLQSKAGAKTLARFLSDNPNSVLRAHVCLALGMSGQRSIASRLVSSLVHADGFVRYCAYRSLRQLTGQDFFADWIYGSRDQWVAAAEHYLRWLGRHRRQR